MAKKKKVKLPDAKQGRPIEYEHADKFMELVLENKMLRLLLETAFGKELIPNTAAGLLSVDLRTSVRNQEFLSELIHLLRIIWYRIEVSDKQSDIFDQPDGDEKSTQVPSKQKEAKLKDKLDGKAKEGGKS